MAAEPGLERVPQYLSLASQHTSKHHVNESTNLGAPKPVAAFEGCQNVVHVLPKESVSFAWHMRDGRAQDRMCKMEGHCTVFLKNSEQCGERLDIGKILWILKYLGEVTVIEML